MNEGWEELKKGPRRSKAESRGPENVWFSPKPNEKIKILKRNQNVENEKQKITQQSLEDKALWPTLGVTGTQKSCQ